jgi:hypothetical protein
VKVIAWYDNEWGYSNRLMELASKVQVEQPSSAELWRRCPAAVPVCVEKPQAPSARTRMFSEPRRGHSAV